MLQLDCSNGVSLSTCNDNKNISNLYIWDEMEDGISITRKCDKVNWNRSCDFNITQASTENKFYQYYFLLNP